MSQPTDKKPVLSPFETFVGEISVRLNDVVADDLETVMNAVMGRIGERYGVDRVQLRWIGQDQGLAPAKAIWARRSDMPVGTYPLEDIRWLSAQIRRGVPVRIDSLDDLPVTAASDRRALEAQGVAALLLSPLTIDKEIVGALALSTYRSFHWSDTIRTEIASLAPQIAGAYWAATNRARLQKSEARYRAVVQDQTEFIIRWTPDGMTTWVNDACCQYLQKSRDELIGTREQNFVSDEEWPELQEIIANLTPQNPLHTGEYEVALSSGDLAWHQWSDRGIFDDSGSLVEVQSVGRDITARKNAEDTVARNAEFQRHKAELLLRLTSLQLENADRVFGESLARIGALYNAARIHVLFFSKQDDRYQWQYRWLQAGSKPPDESSSVNVPEFPWLFDQLRAGESVVIKDANELPAEADEFRQRLEHTECDSFLGFPLIVDGANFGMCTFAATRANAWDDVAIDELKVLSNILATALTRFRTSAELDHRTLFQSRLAGISASLLGAEVGQSNQIIGEFLALIGTDYGFDRVSVTWHDNKLPGFGAPIDWVPNNAAVRHVNPRETPWGFSLMMRGKIDRIDSVDDMSDEAHLDQVVWKRLGFSSVLCLPFVIRKKVLGSATFATCAQRNWDDNTIEELQLIVSAMATAAVRQWSNAELAQRERDLARSQQVAGVGSAKATARLKDDGTVDFLSLSISEQALKIFAIERGSESIVELVSRYYPDDEKMIRRAWRKTITTGTFHEIQYRIVLPDGSIVHVQERVEIDHVDDDRVTTIFGTCKDVTEWVESNRELQLAVAEIEQLKNQLQEENVFLRDEVKAAHGFDTIVGESQVLRKVLHSAEQVAPTDVTVLISGETGTGKELLARSIHQLSHRKDNVMVSVNCAALSPELIASELFGHEKGAFTGARERRKGRFELADGGTLFLDEIGEISGELQAKLLRVIQEGEFERLGGSETLTTDARLIAATNRDLQLAVDEGEFRADLYYRINSFPIHMPALRERKDDIPLLAEHLVKKHARKMGKEVDSISARTLRFLRSQSWPGNVRELEGTIMRALIITSGAVLDYDDGLTETDLATSAFTATTSSSLLDAQRAHIMEILDQTNWVIDGKNGAAVALQLAPSTLRSKMKRLKIIRR